MLPSHNDINDEKKLLSTKKIITMMTKLEKVWFPELNFFFFWIIKLTFSYAVDDGDSLGPVKNMGVCVSSIFNIEIL